MLPSNHLGGVIRLHRPCLTPLNLFCVYTYIHLRCGIAVGLELGTVFYTLHVCGNVQYFGQNRYIKKQFYTLKLCLYIFTVSLSDVNALREEVKHLMELIQKLIMEFRAVRLEVEASHLDIMESVTLAVATCIQSRANNP